jgi:hypothetical protein
MTTRKWGNERTIGDYDAFGGGNGKDWDVAALDSGGYVVTWLDHTTALVTARGQRYDAAGVPVGAVFEIGGSIPGNNKADVVVTGIDGGGFVVAFTNGSNAGDSYFERFNAAGVVQQTTAWDSDTSPEGNQAIVRTAGGFVMVETDQFDGGVVTDGIYMKSFDVNGNLLNGFVHANDDATIGFQTDPSIAALTGGQIVTSWVDYNDQTIKFRILDSALTPITASLIVDDDSFVSGVPEVPPQLVGLANGNFIIVWHESLEPDSADQSGYTVRGMIYSATGTQQSGLMLINSLRTGDQTSPDIVALPDGGFFVSWVGLPSGINSDIKGLQFDAGGIRVGAEITINTTTSGIDIDPHMTVLSDGRIAVVWNEANTGTLRQQIIDPRDGVVAGTENTETLYGNDVFNDEMNGLGGNDTMFGLAGADVMFGGDGLDVLNAGRGDDTLYGGNDADTLNGEAGDDQLFGEGGSDRMSGGIGADDLDGGAGDDGVSFRGAKAGVAVNLLTGVGTSGDAAGDTYLNMESFFGSEFADTVVGGAVAGGFYGFGGDDNITGTALGDRLIGGLGNDTMNGLGGIDRVYYDTSLVLVQVNLATNINSGGEAQGDILSNIEEVSGSAFGDTIIGKSGNERFFGNGGNDRLDGGLGADTLVGGVGSDTFVFVLGQSGQTLPTLDIISDYAKGLLNIGDVIDYGSLLTVGGSNLAATATEASINTTTGVASFAAGSGATLADALADITARMTAATNSIGEFAFFNVNASGSFYAFISDGIAGVTTGDVVMQLNAVTSINTIDLTNGDITILT